MLNSISKLGSMVIFAAMLVIATTASSATSPTVIAWGSDYYYESDVPVDLTNAVSVYAANGHNIAVLADGSLKDWPCCYLPPGLSSVKAVSERFSASLALLSNGTVMAWGGNYYGERDVPPNLSNVVAVAAGNYHSLALKSDGTVVKWGGQNGSGTVPPGLAEVSAIAAGIGQSLALKSNGTVVAWGYNDFGQATVPASLSNVVTIAAGGYHSMALKSDGSVIVWGGQDNSVQPPVGLSNVIAISAGEGFNLALKSDRTVVAWGSNYHPGSPQDKGGPIDVPAGLEQVVAISAGHAHSVALTASTKPLIQRQPQNVTAYSGSNATFAVEAVGPGALFYQWRKDGVTIPGANAATLNLSNLNFENAGAYAVIVSNFGGFATSIVATLSVVALPSPPDFTVTSPSQYYINGQGRNPTLTLVRGQTYRFAINADSIHPFEIVSNPGGTPYNQGVSNNNISSGTITFTVPINAPNTLFYICSIHYFGGTINVVDPPLSIVSIALTTTNTVVLKSFGSNASMFVPQFNSNLVSSNWAIVPGYSSAFLNGTNVAVFNRLEPICGPNVFLRLKGTN